MPSQAKNISRFACIFRILEPAKPGELKLIGMQRHKELDGALNILGEWNSLKTGMKMISIKSTGQYQVNIIAEDNGWISFWHWPNFGIINNGNYPKWDKTLYKAGDEFKLDYHIEIVPKNGKLNSSSRLEFVTP